MPTAWCAECRGTRVVLDHSLECDDGGAPGFRQREYSVTTLACGHEVAVTTGRTYDRVDGPMS